MLSLTVVGNIGQDAEIKHTGDKQFVVFTVAHNERYKNAEGAVVNKTIWVSCIYSRSTNVAPYLKKGTLVSCTGIPSAAAWKDNSSQLRAGLNLTVQSLELHGSNGQQQQAPANNGGYKQPASQQQQGAEDAPPVDENGLPF